MKIGLPGNPKGNNNNQKKNNNNTKPKKKKGNSNKKPKKVEKSEISWREKDGFITAIINRKLIKIDLYNFNIHLPNGFSMKAKSLEEAKKKAIDFLS